MKSYRKIAGVVTFAFVVLALVLYLFLDVVKVGDSLLVKSFTGTQVMFGKTEKIGSISTEVMTTNIIVLIAGIVSLLGAVLAFTKKGLLLSGILTILGGVALVLSFVFIKMGYTDAYAAFLDGATYAPAIGAIISGVLCAGVGLINIIAGK